LSVEILEDRCLLSQGSFLQGFAFVDSNGNGRYDTGEGVAGATVNVFAADAATLANYPGSTLSTVLATATTPPSGYYLFTDASIIVSNTSGLAAGNYLLVETPPSGSSNAGTDIQSQLNTASQVSPSTIRVTLPNPANLVNHFDSFGAGANDTPTLNGMPFFGFTGQLNIHLTDAGPPLTTPQFPSLCLAIDQPVGVGNMFPVLPTSSFANGPQIAYLYNHYGTVPLDSVHAEALQEAVWKLEYGNAFSPDLSHPGVAGAYSFFLSDAAGKSEAAIFLIFSKPPKGTTNGQTMIVTGMLNFSNSTSLASPTLVTAASPAITLGSTAPTLTDSAMLSGGSSPTGSITFTLKQGSTIVFTTSDPVSGNGTYTASFTLPTTGTVTGTYTWSAHYSGDGNNNPADDQGGAAEQTVVSPANPMLSTTASQSITLGTTAPTISDSAVLSGGYFPTGSIAFTLKQGSTIVFTTSDPVSGNGTYSASFTLPTTGTVTGTYTWSAHYSGDGNNNPADDQGGAAEQTVVSPANPAISTTPGGTVVLGSGAKLTDSAVLSGGYSPTGTITFTLFDPSNMPVYSDIVAVSGNGSYSTATGSNPGGFLPTVAGTFEWVASYSGDGNNTSVASAFGDEPQTVVTPPQLGVTKTPDQSMITAGQTAGYVVTIRNTGGSAAMGVSLTDPLPPGPAVDINWMIDTSGTGLGAGTNPTDFQITGAVGSQNLGLSSAFISGGDSLAPGQSISVHITGVTSVNDTTSSTNPALGTAGNYAVLYEGTGGHNLALSNVNIEGNIGIGGTGQAQFSGPLTITGRVDFSAANTGQYHPSGKLTGPTSVNYMVAAVTSALNTVNTLNSSLAGLGANLVINGNQTINESAGQLNIVNGVTYRVFNVTSYTENNGNVVTINGDGSGNPVVFNFGFNSNVNLGGDITLTGGLSDDQVIWNFTTSGKAVSLNNNASSFPLPAAFHGVILAPNDAVSVVNSNLVGRVFGGDSHDMQIVSGNTVIAPASSAKLANTATASATGLASVSASAMIMIQPVAPLVTVTKAADASAIVPGQTIGFVVTISNIGSTTSCGVTARLNGQAASEPVQADHARLRTTIIDTLFAGDWDSERDTP
jgi:uncharacterized repeat protein (TIGR01451 family)